jgi:hypothetical protein
MKALVIALALLVGISAEARSVRMSVDYTLPEVTIDNKPSKLVGVVRVDLLKSDITLDLYQDPCGTLTAKPGTISCEAMASLVRSYTVPLQTRKNGNCGEAIYAGKRDQRPVDGDLTVIRLIDNATNTCEMVLLNLAEVTVVNKTAGFGAPSKTTVVKAALSAQH